MTYDAILSYHNPEGDLVVGVLPDGKIEFGPGFTTPDAESRLFWERIARAVPSFRDAVVASETFWIIQSRFAAVGSTLWLTAPENNVTFGDEVEARKEYDAMCAQEPSSTFRLVKCSVVEQRET